MLANGHNYELVFNSEEPPRFPGDTVCGATNYDVTCDGAKVATISHSLMYHRARRTYTINLAPVCCAGPRTNDHHDCNWHDAGPFETQEDAFRLAIHRCEYIRKWRAALALSTTP